MPGAMTNIDQLEIRDGIDPRRRPILVTGSHRSGSTWVGRVLCSSPGLVYVDEPFNPMNPLGVNPSAEGGLWFRYICRENEMSYLPRIKKVLSFDESLSRLIWAKEYAPWPAKVIDRYASRFIARRYLTNLRHRLFHKRPLLKDPIAIMSAAWLSDTFGMDVVMMMRHPAAFVLSIKEKNWYFRYENLTKQPQLLRDLLQPFERDIRRFAELGEEYDIVEGGCLQWNIIYHVAKTFMDAHPGWLGIRHEDLSRDPLAGFRPIFETLHLDYTPSVEREIQERSAEENPMDGKAGDLESGKRNSKAIVKKWKQRLSADEIARIRELTEPLAKIWYSDQDWA
jgi:sulfotransferase family protein